MAASFSTASSASAATAANPNDKSYAVFLNHRGVDVKKTFARSLYLRLLDNGLSAFMDEGEMQAGYNITSQIEHAVRTIQTHAEKGRHDSNIIKNWRNALYRVAEYSGFELETNCNGVELELELLDKVAKRLSEMLKTPDLYVAQFPTGLDEKLIDFEDKALLKQQRRGLPQLLGIWGLGGVGKTTLAKEFFNRKKSDYRRSCFLFDVKADADKGSLMSLQKELLKSLSGLDKSQ